MPTSDAQLTQVSNNIGPLGPVYQPAQDILSDPTKAELVLWCRGKDWEGLHLCFRPVVLASLT